MRLAVMRAFFVMGKEHGRIQCHTVHGAVLPL